MTEATGQAAPLGKVSIYETLRDRICLLDYQPGDQLNERELAQEFGVSRTPLRTVLQRLETDGLIQSIHGHGTFVTTVDLSAMRDIYTVRMRLMDAMADSEVLPVPEETIEEMDRLLEECRTMIDSQDKRHFALVSMGLHRALHELSSNRVVRHLNTVLFYQTARFWFLLLGRMNWHDEVTDLIDEINRIKRCLVLGDVRTAASVHKSHLSLVMTRVLREGPIKEKRLDYEQRRA